MVAMISKLLPTICFAVAITPFLCSISNATTILLDDFESYANTATMQAVWNEQASGVGTLNSTQGNPGQSMAHPGGTTSNRLFTPTIPTDSAPLIWEFDFYDDGIAKYAIKD